MAQMPPCTAVQGWTQQGEARSFDADNLFEYINGNAEGYLLYHFVGMKGITCKSGEVTLNIDISEFEDTEFAYGMFTSTRDPRLPTVKMGVTGQVTQRKGFFTKDKYYVEISANPEGDHSATLRAFLSIIEKNIQGRTTLPDAFGWFPTENLTPDSIRLVPESVLGLRLLKSGYVAQYQAGKAFLVRESSPEAAAQVFDEAQGALRADLAGQDRRRGVHGQRQVPERNVRLPQGELHRRFCEPAGRPQRCRGNGEARRKPQVTCSDKLSSSLSPQK